MVFVCVDFNYSAVPVLFKDHTGKFNEPVFQLSGDDRMPVFGTYSQVVFEAVSGVAVMP